MGNNMFAYCNNNPANYHDPSGNILAPTGIDQFSLMVFSALFKNTQFRTHVTTPTIMLDGGGLIGEVGFSSTVTQNANSVGILYSFNDVGNDEVRNGIGFNLGNWLGIESGFGSDGNLFADIQITPHTHIEGTIGIDGVELTTGFIKKNASHDFTVRAGWGAIGVALIAPKAVMFALV